MIIAAALILATQASTYQADLSYLHQVAHEVVDGSWVGVGEGVEGVGLNSTGFALRLPGATRTFYPAFWTRDAAMMLGGDLVPREEALGWVRLLASVQPGPEGLSFPHGLIIPPYSMPDHVTLSGEACWFPGAYADQGVGDYGFLPPADDAFYFIQMAHEVCRTRGISQTALKTPWGSHSLAEVCDGAFDSVEVDPTTQLVVCDETPGRERVDWGFCDSIRKTGLCLMPSLLRWQAARRLSEIIGAERKHYRGIADSIRESIQKTFFLPISESEGRLVSSTKVGRRDDVWASAFAVWLGVLKPSTERRVAKHLLALYKQGKIAQDGQIRELPLNDDYGGFWERASSGPKTYQNGGYWATPTGWMCIALAKVDRASAERLLHEYVEFVRANRKAGAPYEWVNSEINARSNGNYGSSAGLVYVSLTHPRG